MGLGILGKEGESVSEVDQQSKERMLTLMDLLECVKCTEQE